MIRLLIFLSSLIIYSYGYAQQLELGFGLGTGASYLIEDLDRSIEVDYSSTLIGYADLRIHLEEEYFSPKLILQYAQAQVAGFNWERFNSVVDGEVSSLSFSVVMEHIGAGQTIQFGYHGGIGITSERFISQMRRPVETRQDKVFLNIMASGFMRYSVSPRFSLQPRLSLFWTDPLNSFQIGNWVIAGEDLSCFVQIGCIYLLKP